MRALFILIVFPLLIAAQDDELVYVKDLIPDVVLDLKYNTLDNFTGQKLYTTNECMLALATVKRLIIIQDSLRNIRQFNGHNYPQGLGIKIWDGYRPRAVQYLMWEILPDPTWVADPNSGSVHNRGGAVDLTLVNLSNGQELDMPTPFDFFGDEAHHGYNNLPAHVIANREFLKAMMTQVGDFSIYSNEWWHYSYQPARSFPLRDFQMK